MGGEHDDGPNLEALARRMEALERENRELREALGGGASDREPRTPQQQPRAAQTQGVAGASSKTVRALLLGPRDEQAYYLVPELGLCESPDAEFREPPSTHSGL